MGRWATRIASVALLLCSATVCTASSSSTDTISSGQIRKEKNHLRRHPFEQAVSGDSIVVKDTKRAGEIDIYALVENATTNGSSGTKKQSTKNKRKKSSKSSHSSPVVEREPTIDSSDYSSSSSKSSRKSKTKKKDRSSQNQSSGCRDDDDDGCAVGSSSRPTKLHKPDSSTDTTVGPSTLTTDIDAAATMEPTVSKVASPSLQETSVPASPVTPTPPQDIPVSPLILLTSIPTASPNANVQPADALLTLITSAPVVSSAAVETTVGLASDTTTAALSKAPANAPFLSLITFDPSPSPIASNVGGATSVPLPAPTVGTDTLPSSTELPTSAPASSIFGQPEVFDSSTAPPVPGAGTDTLPSGTELLPTSAPAASIFGQPEVFNASTVAPTTKALVEPFVFQKTVLADPLYMEVIGTFDPAADSMEETFFRVIEDNFDPYSRAYLGDTLKETDLTIAFLEDYSAKRLRSVVISSWSEITVAMKVGSENIHDVDAFTKEDATKHVEEFFSHNNHKTRLINRLNEADLGVNDIVLFDTLPDNVATSDPFDDDDETVAAGDAAALDQETESSPKASSSSKSWVAALVSGCVIFAAVGCVIASTRNEDGRKRQGNTNHHDSNSSPDPRLTRGILRRKYSATANQTSSHSDDDDDDDSAGVAFPTGRGATPLQSSALHLRMTREQEARRLQSVESSDSTISSYRTLEGAPVLTVEEAVRLHQADPPSNDDTDDQPSPRPTFRDPQSFVDAERARLERGETDPMASTALICLDSNDSTYPELTVYPYIKVTPPPSPVWSMDHADVCHTTPFRTETDDLAARPQWDDEANDVLALLAQPDYSVSSHVFQSSDSDNDDSSQPSHTESSKDDPDASP